MSRMFNNIFFSLFILAALLPVALPEKAAADFTSPAGKLLQFTSAGHVLGFATGEYYVAGGDHTLKVQFVDGSGIHPVAADRDSGQRNTCPLEKVTYSNAWNGVDIEYTVVDGGIAESTYYLKTPEAAAGIRLRYNRSVSLDRQGSLVISYKGGNMVESAPVAWQQVDGKREYVAAEYIIYGENEVGFTLAECRAGLPVVIDPVIVWNTFMGGSEAESCYGIAVDEEGNVYITGQSMSSWGTPKRPYFGNGDAFVACTNSIGDLQWNTFLGGFGIDAAMNIVEYDGFVYVVGTSDSLWGTPTRTYSGGNDAFAAKLNGMTGNLEWHTFLGNNNDDLGYGVAINGNELYVIGQSRSSWGAPVRGFQGAGDNAFVVCLYSSNWGNLKWNTFLGGSSGNTCGYAICTNGRNIYAAGGSSGTWGEPRRAFSGGTYDAFAARLKLSGELQWNTFLGAAGEEDRAFGVAVDNIGDVWVTGASNAAWGSPRQAFAGGPSDAFVARLNNLGDLQWNTFMGGNDADAGRSIVIDDKGCAYIDGDACTTWGTPWRNFVGTRDAFVAKLDPSGWLASNAFFGGDTNVFGHGIAMDNNKNIYIAGSSQCSWGSPVHNYSGGGMSDAFIAKVNDPDLGGLPIFPTPGPNTGSVATTLGIVSFGLDNGSISGLSNAEAGTVCSAPSGYCFPYGLFSFTISEIDAGQSVMVTIKFPRGIPAAYKYYKCINGVLIDVTSLTTRMDDSTLVLTLTDGGRGDADGAVNGSILDPGGLAEPVAASTMVYSHGTGYGTAATPPSRQVPISLPSISITSASLSAAKVAPGTPVTVTADVVNTGTTDGSISIQVYVNGEVDSARTVTVSSGGGTPVTFTITRTEPGSYTIYVNGSSAGSFMVDQQADPNIILYISAALVLFSLAGGVIYMARRKTGY